MTRPLTALGATVFLVAAGESVAQEAVWDAGDVCVLNKTLKMSARKNNRGRKTRLKKETRLTIWAVEDQWVLVEAGRKSGYLPLAGIDQSCVAVAPVEPERLSAPAEEPAQELEPIEVEPVQPDPEPPPARVVEAVPVEVPSQPAPDAEPETTETAARRPVARPLADPWASSAAKAELLEPEEERESFYVDLLGGGGFGLSGAGGKPVFDANLGLGWRLYDNFSLGMRLVFHGVPDVAGTGYGFGGGGVALRYNIPIGSSLEPYAQLDVGGGFGGAGSPGVVGIGRLALGGRFFLAHVVCLQLEVAMVASQVSVAAVGAVGFGLSF